MKTIQRIHKIDGEVVEREKLLTWFNRMLDRLSDGEYILDMDSTTRTDAQNRYYWGVIIPTCANTFGITRDEMHEFFKDHFLPSQEYFVLTRQKKLSSTTAQTIDEMSSYLEKTIKFAAEQGIVIPDAEEYKHLQ